MSARDGVLAVLALAGLVAGPVLLIWALNTLVATGIPLTWATWAAALVVMLLVLK